MPQLKKNFEQIKKFEKIEKKNSSKSSYCEPLGKKPIPHPTGLQL
jgi:hypothetical protein